MKYLIISFLILITTLVKGQDYSPKRYNFKAVGIAYNLTNNGNGIGLNYSKANKNSTISKIVLGWDNGNIGNATTSYNNISLSYSIIKPIYDINEIFFFNIGGGAYTSYEMLKNDILDMTKQRIGYGFLGTAEIEYYYNRFGFSISADQIYKVKSEIGNWQWKLNIGIKYVLH